MTPWGVVPDALQVIMSVWCGCRWLCQIQSRSSLTAPYPLLWVLALRWCSYQQWVNTHNMPASSQCQQQNGEQHCIVPFPTQQAAYTDCTPSFGMQHSSVSQNMLIVLDVGPLCEHELVVAWSQWSRQCSGTKGRLSESASQIAHRHDSQVIHIGLKDLPKLDGSNSTRGVPACTWERFLTLLSAPWCPLPPPTHTHQACEVPAAA
jgi:hypothetical protein